MSCLLHSGVECFHLDGKSSAKLVENVIMDLVILVRYLLLDRAVVNKETTEELVSLGCLESASALCDFIEHLVPLLNLVTKDFVDQIFLLVDIPESLIVSPSLNVGVGLGEFLLKLGVD